MTNHKRNMVRQCAPLALALVAACATGSPQAGSAARPAADPFDALVAEVLRGPATSRRSADPLRWLTADGSRESRVAAEQQLARLRAVDTTRLAEAQRIDFLALEASLKGRVASAARETWRRSPMSYLLFDPIYRPLAGSGNPTAAEWRRVATSLRTFRRATELGRAQLSDAPPLWIAMARATGANMQSFLDAELPRRAAGAPDDVRAEVLAANDSARAALTAYLNFLDTEVSRGAATSWAVGAEEYNRLLREEHMLPYDAAALITRGQELHERTKQQLDSLAEVISPGVGWRELSERMKRNHPVADSIRAAYEKESRRAEALIIRDNLFYVPPCEELLFIDTPPQLRATYAYGGYSSASPDDSVHTGRFFVTPVEPGMTAEQREAKLRGHNHGWITVVALHEGYPGHHLQYVKSFQNPRLLRRRLTNTYFIEGWGLYAEDFMRRAGFYETDDARLTQLRMRLWRTARVIIDPSIHTGRMTYEEAVDLLVNDVGLERADAEAEVNRYTTWPSQAPSYIVGWLEIERLKDEARAGGTAFDEFEFHERLLTRGALPLALVRRAMAEFYPVLR